MKNKTNRFQSAFTLLELMLVLGIVALLMLLSLPSYNNYVLRTYRVEAVEALLKEAGRQERNYLVKRRFIESPTHAGVSGCTESALR